MKPQVDLRIIPVTEEDYEVVGNFLKRFFYTEEPLNFSLKRNPSLEEIPFKSILNEHRSFKAVDVLDQSEDNIAGIVLNKEMKFGEEKKPESGLLCSKTLKIRKVLDEIDQRSKIWDKVNNETHFDIMCVAVNTKYRGLKVGQKLMEHSLDFARSRNYKYVTVTCTSFYSARIALTMGFEIVYELPYDEYLNEEGKPVFKVQPPHVAMKKMNEGQALVLDCENYLDSIVDDDNDAIVEALKGLEFH